MESDRSNSPHVNGFAQQEAFVRALCSEFPILAPLLEKHIRAYLGEIVPLVFAADLAGFIGSPFIAPDTGGRAKKDIRSILVYLEEKYVSDQSAVSDFVWEVSFHLPKGDEVRNEIREMLGPVLSGVFCIPRPEAVTVIRSSAERFPSLAAILAEHISDFDEILSHLFMADVERHVRALFISFQSGGPGEQELREILDFLETAFAAASVNDDVDNMIAVSFIEHLPFVGEKGWEICEMLGPTMRQQYDVVNGL